jgi:hypothetical protein
MVALGLVSVVPMTVRKTCYERFGVACVQHQFGYPICHLITIDALMPPPADRR